MGPNVLIQFSPFIQCVVHVKVVQVGKGQSPRKRELLSPTENTAPEMPRQLSRLQFRDFFRHSVAHLRNVWIFAMEVKLTGG